ncbi:tetratricopeptide repeat protein [Pendulispora albinea]|uniref:Tetratricopeptide repeat protein n=1 Tax=Pendulispora albinea TaxID=2741071 RepID=A0ABZ2LWG8_9BACT
MKKSSFSKASMRLGVISALALASAVGCGSATPQVASPSSLASARDQGRASGDAETVGRWALLEMVAPGGDAGQAKNAAGRLRQMKHEGLYGSLALGVYDEMHGDPRSAADNYAATLVAARQSDDPDGRLVAWFATNRLRAQRGSVAELYTRHKKTLEDLLARPGKLGWRAVAELSDWSNAEAFDKAAVIDDAYDAQYTARAGCGRKIRLAGPFGRGTSVDRRRTFAAEEPRPWPPSWEPDPFRGTRPHVLKVEQHRCLAGSPEQAGKGVYYAEAFFSTDTERDLILAVAGAIKVWIDDVPILERDLREWGVWQRFGAAARVGPGRHRVLARLLNDSTSFRFLQPDGKPAGIVTDVDGSRPYGLSKATPLPNVNPLDPMVQARKASSPLQAYLAASLASIDGLDDVASALVEPYVEPADAGAVALQAAAGFAHGDPIYPEETRRQNERRFRTRAVERDPSLWYSRAWLALDLGEQKGLVEGVEPLRKLADEFRGEPEILEGLGRVYGRLGWRAERMRAFADLSQRFPDDADALRAYLDALEEDGPLEKADSIAERVKKLDPETEVELDRALARHDWKAAVDELRRLAKRRPDRKEIASRIADVLARAGNPAAAAAELDKALAKNPQDATARFRLADRAFSKGDRGALRRALAESIQAGANIAELRDAITVVEGATNLEPYRIDGRAVIRDFERWEKSGKKMAGNAARVLDYSALWVHPDGSSEMLEHEIQRMQSQEAVGKESEQQPPQGLVLRLRVIKPDGTVLEPEPVEGKPTLTLPHLEIGDYVELEHVTSFRGDGEKGKTYKGPHWFFREADKGYWRSEFVTLTPKDRPLDIETRGNVGQPKVKTLGTFVERRWRVDESPPAPEEPDAVPPTEFLPSVRIGWGQSLQESLARLVDFASDETPLDPRLGKMAREIVKGVPEKSTSARAERLYHHVLTTVEEGNENDGRRALTGRSGSLQSAFGHLLRQLNIPLELAVVKNRLAPPPLGKMSEAEVFDSVVLRIPTESGVRWLTVRDKFAPFGYLAAGLRGQPAYRLIPGTPLDKTATGGDLDGVSFEGRALLREDGSATLELAQSFRGKVGASLRAVFDRIAAGQVRDFVETRLVGRNFPGARVRDVSVEGKQTLDAPLVVRVHAEVPQLARAVSGGLSLKQLFPMRLAQLAALSERQTPQLISGSSHVDVKFEVVVPETMRMPSSLPVGEVRDGERIVRVGDTVRGHALYLDRVVDIPAGRVQPGDEYTRFQRFSQEADQLVEREIMLGR